MTALYRKYRPRTFDEIIGQDHVTQPLIQALRNGRLNHAYLFSGPRGCGKTSSARILARSLNCEQGPTPNPCGECRSCRDLAPDGAGSIDVIEIDAASHGGVDDARELREKAFFAPVSSRFKVYVIDEAHMVSSAGFNALLKLVEEPPDYVRFVFATTEPEKVLGTIKSRTHHYPFRLIPPSILRPYCEQLAAAEGVAIEPAVFPLVVKAGTGSARDTLSILDQLIAGAGEEGVTYQRAVALLGVTDAALIDETVDALADADGAALFATIDRVVEAGHDPRRFATDLLERFRDLIVLQQVPDAIGKGLLDVPADEVERMTAQALRLGTAELSRLAELVHDGLATMRGTTAPRLTLELICARMLLPGAEQTTAALLQRLERLESKTHNMVTGVPAPAAAAVPAAGPTPVPPAAQSAPTRADTSRPAAESPAAGSQRPAPGQASQTPQPGQATQPAGSPSQSAPPAFPAGQALPPAGSPGAPASAVPQPTPHATPTPPATPPVPSGALDVVAVQRAWDEVLGQVRNRSLRASALVRQVTVRDLDGITVVLVCQNKFQADEVTKASGIVEEALLQVLGTALKIRCDIGGGGTPPPRPATPTPGPAPAPQPRPAPSAPAARPQAGPPPTSSRPAPTQAAPPAVDDEEPWPDLPPSFDEEEPPPAPMVQVPVAPAQAVPEYEGFEPGDEPGDEVVDKDAPLNSEEQAMKLLSEMLGAQKIS
ncbi:DNA polymerase III subunit gamma and tau [Longispora fulva]|uniref:DNA polymerase III subunit gamma/tau n=1 Tax=Longispora fulva TaxID=619741 RepID=A0A8J7GEY9_9ACTN|nr:DNA polymerase III subunit gamma and tau [Longispora fulva]MBG6139413.1 DNA polymerase-3 subunit gamma/tau [Longispora fulva]GIG58912.1 DNA polymerase III subunit gamma and tau [Longispora fulva]